MTKETVGAFIISLAIAAVTYGILNNFLWWWLAAIGGIVLGMIAYPKLVKAFTSN